MTTSNLVDKDEMDLQTQKRIAELEKANQDLRAENRALNRDINECKRTEEALRESEEKYRLIVETANEGISLVDLEFRVLFTNEKLASMLGYSVDEMLGRSFLDFLDNENKTAGHINMKKRQNGIAESLEYKFIRKDGSSFWVHSNTRPILDDEGRLVSVLSMMTDITERKRAEEALRKSEERQAFMLKLSDALGAVEEANETLSIATRMLAEHLRASRVQYFLAEGDPETKDACGIIKASYGREIPPMTGRYRMADFGIEPTDSMRAKITVVPNVFDDKNLSEEEIASYKAVSLGAWMSVPLIRKGRFVAALVIHQKEARDWTPEEIELARETAERTWAAVERARAEEALRESQTRLENELIDTKLLHTISSELLLEDDIQELYEKILDAAVTIMHSHCASMQMLYPERGNGGELHLLAFRGFNLYAAKFWEWVRIDSESSCGIALNTGKRVICPDIENCDFMDGSEDQATYIQTGIRAVQTTPLISRAGKVVGMISTHWCNPHEPSDRDLRLLDILARQAADLIEHKKVEQALKITNETLEERVQERTEELEKAYTSLREIDIVRKQEIHHRIKNNLQVISSLLDLQAEKFRGKKNIEDSQVLESFKEGQDRVISMALIHEELHKGGKLDRLNFSSYIQELSDNLFLSYRLGSDNISLVMDIEEDIFFDMDTSVPLGIIINELISNSLKHAFSGRENGEIKINLQKQENEDCEIEDSKSINYILSVADNGVGIPEEFDIEDIDGLGLQLVTTLVDQLDGELELKRDNRTEFTVKFTVTEKDNQTSNPARIE